MTFSSTFENEVNNGSGLKLAIVFLSPVLNSGFMIMMSILSTKGRFLSV